MIAFQFLWNTPRNLQNSPYFLLISSLLFILVLFPYVTKGQEGVRATDLNPPNFNSPQVKNVKDATKNENSINKLQNEPILNPRGSHPLPEITDSPNLTSPSFQKNTDTKNSDKFPLKEPLMPTSIVQRTFSKSISSEDIEPSISWPHIQRPTHATFNGRASPAIATTTASVREVSIETPTATKRRPLPMTTQLQNSETNSPEFFKGLPSSRISVFNPLIADKNDMKPGETLSQIQSQTMSSFQPSNVSFNDFEANTSHLDLNKKISISSGEKFNSTATQPEGTQDPISNRLKIFLAAGGSALLLAFGTGSILYLSLKKKKSGIGFADSSVNGVKSHMEEEVYFVHIPYVPELEDELKLSVGDQVIIQERFQDKWVLGTNLTTGDSGCFPLLCLNADAASSIGSEYDISTIESSTYINCVYQEKQSRTSSLFKGRQ